MDIAKYQTLTGLTIDDEDKPLVTAQIRRTKTLLESMLGYSLDKKKAGENQYSELGKAKIDCLLEGVIWGGDSLDDLELDPADEVEGTYRLFSYNKADQFFSVDPYTTLYKVKLVFMQPGAEPNGITHRTFTDERMRVHQSGKIKKYIERRKDYFCTCWCDNCVQVAVDANWLNEDCLPDDLAYIWADMVGYYIDEKKNIKSETLATHSYTKETVAKPEELPESLKIIKTYAGPHGSVNKTIVI